MTTMKAVSLSGLSEDHHAKPRAIFAIANDIITHWKKPYYGAVPYLKAMRQLDTMRDSYGQDSARSVIVHFLGNANTFRGEHARRIKKELNDLLMH